MGPQPRPRQYSSTYTFFLIHSMKGWNKKNYMDRPNDTLVLAIT
jgi:hypothetical protein